MHNQDSLKRWLCSEMNDEDDSIRRKFKGNILEYYKWLKQMQAVAPKNPHHYFVTPRKEVLYSELFTALDEMMKDGENDCD